METKKSKPISYGYIYEIKSDNKITKVGFSYSKNKIKSHTGIIDIVKVFMVDEKFEYNKRFQRRLGETEVNRYLRENKIVLNCRKGNAKVLSNISEDTTEVEDYTPSHPKGIMTINPKEFSYYSDTEQSDCGSECESENGSVGVYSEAESEYCESEYEDESENE
jgi:hypothetical protein